VGRGIHRLTPAKVRAAKVGRHADGGNLYLDVEQGANGLTRKWLFRYAIDGRERHMGLGPAHTIGLAEARERARTARQQLLDGIDPIEARIGRIAEQRLATMQAITFEEAARQYIDSHDAAWRSAKHRREWANTLKVYAYPIIGSLPVQGITVDLVLRVLRPIWETKTETASRLRGRIEAVLDFAKARQLRNGDNPAAWDVLQHLLPQPSKLQPKRHLSALPYTDVGALTAELRKLKGGAPRALEFLILTAVRSGEVRGARWSEIDGGVWTIPPERTKTHREHRVPLCSRALEILDEMRAVRTGDLVFEGLRGAISIQGLLYMLLRLGRKGITVHGFRSTFRDWCGARTNFPREVAEMALAHRIGNATENAYARSDLFEKRRRLMAAWGEFCATQSTGDVVPIKRGRS
jgi:integrase